MSNRNLVICLALTHLVVWSIVLGACASPEPWGQIARETGKVMDR